MNALIAIIQNLFEGLDLRGRWRALGGFIIMAILVLIVFEQITGFFYYSNIEKKTDLLEKLWTLSNEGISADATLNPIYSDLVEELELRKVPHTQLSIIENLGKNLSNESFWKWVSGASIWLFLAVLAPFGVYGKENKIIFFSILIVVGIVFGFIGSKIPTIIHPWANYLSYPLLQLFLLYLLSHQTKIAKKAT